MKGFSNQTAEVMLQSRRESTHQQYNSYLTEWIRYCNQNSIDVTHATVPQALDFLDSLRVSRNLGYNALNTARSALSSILQSPDGIPFGQNTYVKAYMKGTFNLKPPTPRYNAIWDPDILLRKLKTWAPAHSLD